MAMRSYAFEEGSKMNAARSEVFVDCFPICRRQGASARYIFGGKLLDVPEDLGE